MPRVCRVCGTNEVPSLAKVSGMCNTCAIEASKFYKVDVDSEPAHSFSGGFKNKSSFKKGDASLKKKPMKASSKSKSKQTQDISNFKEYAKRKINAELRMNDACKCLECSMRLDSGLPLDPSSQHVLCTEYIEGMRTPFIAHLISGGARPDLYLLKENSIFLCWHHHMMLDQNSGGPANEMLCWPIVEAERKFIYQHETELKNLPHNQGYKKGNNENS